MSHAALSAMGMSLQLAALALLISAPLAIGLAWWMTRVRWRGKVLLDAVILLPLGLPPAVIGFWLMAALGDQGAFGRWLRHDLGWVIDLYPGAAVGAACIMTVPMMARMLRPVFEAHDPMLLPVARTLGASDWHAWRSVALPLTLPAIGSAMALGFAAAWGESGAVLVLAASGMGGTLDASQPTLPLALWQTLAASGRPQSLAWEVATLSLGVAALAVVGSELLRWQWQNRWQGNARINWRSGRS